MGGEEVAGREKDATGIQQVEARMLLNFLPHMRQSLTAPTQKGHTAESEKLMREPPFSLGHQRLHFYH